MKTYKNYLLAGSGLVLLLGSFILSVPRVTQGQSGDPVGPPKPVQVINTAAEPVPVTGSITGNITGDVNVANTPNVNVANTVRVSDAPRQPFSFIQHVSIPDGEGAFIGFRNFTVPAGKQLIVTYASADFNLPGGQKLRLRISEDNGSTTVAIFQLVPVLLGRIDNGSFDTFVASEPMNLYLREGHSLSIFVSRTDIAGPCSGDISLSGYLVDVP